MFNFFDDGSGISFKEKAIRRLSLSLIRRLIKTDKLYSLRDCVCRRLDDTGLWNYISHRLEVYGIPSFLFYLFFYLSNIFYVNELFSAVLKFL